MAVVAGERPLLRVAGCCIEPDLLAGTAARVQRSSVYLPGDVLAFWCPHRGRRLMHRFLGYVWGRGGWGLVTMADRGARPDVPMVRCQVLSKVVESCGMTYRARPRNRLEAVRRYLVWSTRLFRRRIRRAVGKVFIGRPRRRNETFVVEPLRVLNPKPRDR
jgi:hypothetical protein